MTAHLSILFLLTSVLSLSATELEWETGVFTDAQTPPTVHLLFEPAGEVEVLKADHSETYEEGRDFTLAGRTLTRTEDSRIPLLPFYSDKPAPPLYRFADTQGRVFYNPGGNTKHLGYDVEIRYEPTEGPYRWTQIFEGATSGNVPAAIAKLQAGGPFTLAVLGDSISVGAQASGLAPAAPPERPGYAQQFADSLGEQFPKANVTLENPSVGGTVSGWGAGQSDALAAKSPDLAVIAFGMNDGSQDNPLERYRSNVELIVKKLRAPNPDLSIILVASFLPNPESIQANYELRKGYASALRELADSHPNTAFVDIGIVSERIVARKKFADISGNVFNHPNDYLMRVYRDLILTLFEPNHP